jgi:hypothetical protein
MHRSRNERERKGVKGFAPRVQARYELCTRSSIVPLLVVAGQNVADRFQGTSSSDPAGSANVPNQHENKR